MLFRSSQLKGIKDIFSDPLWAFQWMQASAFSWSPCITKCSIYKVVSIWFEVNCTDRTQSQPMKISMWNEWMIIDATFLNLQHLNLFYLSSSSYWSLSITHTIDLLCLKLQFKLNKKQLKNQGFPISVIILPKGKHVKKL